MILDYTDQGFEHIFNDKNLFLPLYWNGKDFIDTLDEHFKHYLEKIKNEYYTNIMPYSANLSGMTQDYKNIRKVCKYILQAVAHYLNGFPSQAYQSIKKVMSLLLENPLEMYEKNVNELFVNNNYHDKLSLYRVVCVDEKIPYERSRVFHTPYTLRSKIATNRYSIAGYPSLYLATSLNLCCEEINYNPHVGYALASKFKLNRDIAKNNTEIKVIELAVKPQDFLSSNQEFYSIGRHIDSSLLNSSRVKKAYYMWYPLIAACSYIRPNKHNPFAVEYIVPQLVMQWVREEINPPKNKLYDQLVGIRYFSCATYKASELGFNYVFPTSGKQQSPHVPFCPVLIKTFSLTEPVFLHDYPSTSQCEADLSKKGGYMYITY